MQILTILVMSCYPLGEKRPNIPLHFEFTHPMWPEQLSVHLRSDADGVVHLGDLLEVTEVSCITTSVTWELQSRGEHVYPNTIHGIEGQPVQLPFTQRDILFIRSVSLFSGTPGSKSYR